MILQFFCFEKRKPVPTISHKVLRKFIYNLYIGAGGVEEDAQIVSNHLVDANLTGHDSHGVINAIGYANAMKDGPSAETSWKSYVKHL
ncbi:TPA: hypothetical protein EYN65_02190 [Candidatus Poribacteria bacterium]|nr:hypothetical protein [Candidatus Poribacteria bacterium]HIO79017.1 hypothetical protein [Candidatus Poribacteria bacterium]